MASLCSLPAELVSIVAEKSENPRLVFVSKQLVDFLSFDEGFYRGLCKRFVHEKPEGMTYRDYYRFMMWSSRRATVKNRMAGLLSYYMPVLDKYEKDKSVIVPKQSLSTVLLSVVGIKGHAKIPREETQNNPIHFWDALAESGPRILLDFNEHYATIVKNKEELDRWRQGRLEIVLYKSCFTARVAALDVDVKYTVYVTYVRSRADVALEQVVAKGLVEVSAQRLIGSRNMHYGKWLDAFSSAPPELTLYMVASDVKA